MARQADEARSVLELVAPVVRRLVAVLIAMATVCVLAVIVSTAAVRHVTDDVDPSVAIHQELVQHVADLELSVSSWARSGDESTLRDYDQALDLFRATRVRLVRATAYDDDLAAAVDLELARVDEWLDDYATSRVASPGGPRTFVESRFQRGRRLYDAYGTSRQATEGRLELLQARASEGADLRLLVSVLVILVLLVGSWLLIRGSRRRLLTELSAPLIELEQVVVRMRAGELGVSALLGGPKEVRAIARAVNELAEAQTRARAVEGRIADELHTLDSAKDDFVSNVSHELRTPLTTISGYLELISEEFEGALEPRHERMLDATSRNVTRLRALIDDLLTLAKAEHPAEEFEPTDLVDLVADAVADVRITAARRGVAVDVTLPSRAVVLGERTQLSRALVNVLSNAVKFSRDGDTVTVVLRLAGEWLELVVRDTGIGIPAAELDRLGTRFFRASNAKSNEIAGTGLGLRIVQAIVDRHGGELVIESREGRGTSVGLRLPAAEPAPIQEFPRSFPR